MLNLGFQNTARGLHSNVLLSLSLFFLSRRLIYIAPIARKIVIPISAIFLSFSRNGTRGFLPTELPFGKYLKVKIIYYVSILIVINEHQK